MASLEAMRITNLPECIEMCEIILALHSLLGTSASLLVTSALLVVTRSY